MTVAELLQELEQEAGNTRRTLERVPEDRLAWKPHEKSPSLGQLALHIAMLPGAITDVALKPAYEAGPRLPRPSAGSRAELLETFDQSLAQAKARLGAVDDAALGATWKMMNGDRVVMELPRGAVLRTVLLNHWYHHRGQLTVYLRLLGVPLPAIYGPSADENPFARD
jgi:uncharacterized damage-inducible protein DinB